MGTRLPPRSTMPNCQPSTSVSLYREVYGAGDPILCLHGLGANLYSWRHFIAPFSQHNKLILVDFKGCGRSPKPLDAQQWKLSASHSSDTAVGASTLRGWSTGAPQAPGMWFSIELPQPTLVTELQFDSVAALGGGR